MREANKTIVGTLHAWLDLIRIYNVPIPLGCLLVGAFAAPADLGLEWGALVLAALFGCAATQAFNDYEDRQTDACNASFRPIPSGRLTSSSVLVGGYLFTLAFAFVSFLFEPWALIPVGFVFLTTRYYSRLKKSTLLHHLLLPAALGALPVAGSLMVHHEVLPLAVVAGISIFLLDVNMNIVGTFKDLFDGAADERVLPQVWGARPAILVALVCGVLGASIPAGVLLFSPSLVSGAGLGALLPLGIGLALTLHSRIRLYRTPNATVGYAALKSGRLTECASFPALIASVMPMSFALSLIALLTFAAFAAQSLIPEARIPDHADQPLTDSL